MQTLEYDLILFTILAVAILITAIMVLEAKDMSHAIIFLAMVFVGISLLYLLLSMELLFYLEISVYAGGVIVLFLFALMLTRTEEFVIRGDYGNKYLRGILMFVIFTFMMFFTVVQAFKSYAGGNPDFTLFNDISRIPVEIFNNYLASFIILGLLVLGVLLGAIFLIKNEGEPEPILDRTDLIPPYSEETSSEDK